MYELVIDDTHDSLQYGSSQSSSEGWRRLRENANLYEAIHHQDYYAHLATETRKTPRVDLYARSKKLGAAGLGVCSELVEF